MPATERVNLQAPRRNSPVTWIPRIAGQRVVLDVDGLDGKRRRHLKLASVKNGEKGLTKCTEALIGDRKGRYKRVSIPSARNRASSSSRPRSAASSRRSRANRPSVRSSQITRRSMSESWRASPRATCSTRL